MTTCVKETAMEEMATHVETWPTVWKRATGAKAFRNFFEILGTGCRPVPHMKAIQTTPAPSWIVDKSHGYE